MPEGDRHFHCTACGKCCHGWLPLTLNDALANAGRFPLAMVWTPVPQGTRSFALSATLGTTVELRRRTVIAVQIAPMAYVPPSMACPALEADGRCGIHADKPLRCKTMPFFAYREENDQQGFLVPRDGWECDVSNAAPVVYRDGKVLARGDFDRERRDLIDQAPILRAYADKVLGAAPNVVAALEKAARKKTGGYVVLNFTAVLPRLPDIDMAAFAAKQLPVLTAFADKTAGQTALKDFHRHYRECAQGLQRFLDAVKIEASKG